MMIEMSAENIASKYRNTDSLLSMPTYRPTHSPISRVCRPIPNSDIGNILNHLYVLILRGNMNISPALDHLSSTFIQQFI